MEETNKGSFITSTQFVVFKSGFCCRTSGEDGTVHESATLLPNLEEFKMGAGKEIPVLSVPIDTVAILFPSAEQAAHSGVIAGPDICVQSLPLFVERYVVLCTQLKDISLMPVASEIIGPHSPSGVFDRVHVTPASDEVNIQPKVLGNSWADTAANLRPSADEQT